MVKALRTAGEVAARLEIVYLHHGFARMWWWEMHPISVTEAHLLVGSCFPKSTVARADFAEVAERYYKRWDISIPEDNEISAVQQIGLSAPLVHDLGNWVVDRVLD